MRLRNGDPGAVGREGRDKKEGESDLGKEMPDVRDKFPLKA